MHGSNWTLACAGTCLVLFFGPVEPAQAELPPLENCYSDDDCPGSFAPYCDLDTNLCEPCVVDEHCEAEFVCHQHECVPQCFSDDDCQAPASYCAGDGVCYECLEDAHCEGDASLCLVDEEVGECVECIVDDDCGEDEPWCKWNNTCVECVEHADCPEDQFCSQDTCVPDICEPGALSCSDNGMFVLECNEWGSGSSAGEQCLNNSCEDGSCGESSEESGGGEGETGDTSTSTGSGTGSGEGGETGDPGAELEGRGCSCSSADEGPPLGSLGLALLTLFGVRARRRRD